MSDHAGYLRSLADDAAVQRAFPVSSHVLRGAAGEIELLRACIGWLLGDCSEGLFTHRRTGELMVGFDYNTTPVPPLFEGLVRELGGKVRP